MRKFFLLITAISTLAARGQYDENDTISPWVIGVSVGYYLTDDSPVDYYSGLDNNRFSNVVLNNMQFRQMILDYYKVSDYSIFNFPSDITYQNNTSFELSVAYNLKKNWSVNLNFMNTRLTAIGIFSLKLDKTNPNSPEPPLAVGQISGQETRSHINLCIGKNYDLGGNFYAKAQVGLDLNVIGVQNNKITIVNTDFNILFNNVANPSFNTPGTTQPTFGLGLISSGILGYQTPAGYGIYLKLNYLNSSINVNDISKARSNIIIPSIGFSKGF